MEACDESTPDFLSFDVVVIGTNLFNSLLVASLSARGYRVGHLESYSNYGGEEETTYNLFEIIGWVDENLINLKSKKIKENNQKYNEDSIFKKILENHLIKNLKTKCWYEINQESKFINKKIFTIKKGEKGEKPIITHINDINKIKNTFLISENNKILIELTPRLLYSSSAIVKLLLQAGIEKYLEFRTFDQPLQKTEINLKKKSSENQLFPEFSGWKSVPMSKSSIFNDDQLSLIEKRKLMKFLTSSYELVCEIERENGNLCENTSINPEFGSLAGEHVKTTTSDIIEKKNSSESACYFLPTYPNEKHVVQFDNMLKNLSPNLKKLVLETLISSSDTSYEALYKIARFIFSIGIHSFKNPLLIPIYGICEINQALARRSALNGATQLISTTITKSIINEKNNNIVGYILSNGVVIQTPLLIIPKIEKNIYSKKNYLCRGIFLTLNPIFKSFDSVTGVCHTPEESVKYCGNPIYITQLHPSIIRGKHFIIYFNHMCKVTNEIHCCNAIEDTAIAILPYNDESLCITYTEQIYKEEENNEESIIWPKLDENIGMQIYENTLNREKTTEINQENIQKFKNNCCNNVIFEIPYTCSGTTGFDINDKQIFLLQKFLNNILNPNFLNNTFNKKPDENIIPKIKYFDKYRTIDNYE